MITAYLPTFPRITSDRRNHESFEEYLYCKSLLFRQCRVGIVNADDPHWEEILKGHTCQVRTFSAEGNDVKDQVVDLFASDLGYTTRAADSACILP